MLLVSGKQSTSVSGVGAWRSLHIVPGGLPSILATKSHGIPTNPWLMEIPASILLPQAGLAHSQSAQIEEGWWCGRSQLLEEAQREKS